MKSKLLKFMFSVAGLLLILSYNNCAPLKHEGPTDRLKADGGTTVGTPLVEFKFENYPDAATKPISMCVDQIVLTSDEAGTPDMTLELAPQDVKVTAASSSFAAKNLRAGSYSRITMSLSDLCDSRASLTVKNTNGDFSTSRRLRLAFNGRSRLDSNNSSVVFSVQDLSAALTPVTNSSALEAVADSFLGSWNTVVNAWSAIALVGSPTARSEHTAVWAGSKMIVWGGLNLFESPTVKDSGAMFDPTSQTWQTMPTTSSPSARRNHTAVAAGDKMIVWGGEDSAGNPLRDGAIFDSATKAWTSMSSASAPVARTRHSAIWTGSDLIVWGGIANDGSKLNDGGIYTLSTNSWRPIAASGAPSARASHTAIWTGAKMIVWGGCSSASSGCPVSSSALNSGGVYDPRTDTWQSMSLTGAPTSRYKHTAIWTGSEMIVWGGESYASGSHFYLSDGARYRVDSNSWTAISNSGAPTQRTEHTAVWTGSKMIIWGGISNSTFMGSGAVYDVTANSWTPMASSSAPTARKSHTAVWTGREMLVWGGWNNTMDPAFRNDGSSYRP